MIKKCRKKIGINIMFNLIDFSLFPMYIFYFNIILYHFLIASCVLLPLRHFWTLQILSLIHCVSVAAELSHENAPSSFSRRAYRLSRDIAVLSARKTGPVTSSRDLRARSTIYNDRQKTKKGKCLGATVLWLPLSGFLTRDSRAILRCRTE